VNLRDVVARMLGLSLQSLAVPDYELISRLEQLILANQANVSAAVALESALVSSADQLGEGFQAGYRHAGRAVAARGARGGAPSWSHQRGTETQSGGRTLLNT